METNEHEWYVEAGGDGEGRYQCAFCGQPIEPTGFDPCEVAVQAARSIALGGDHWDPGMWWCYVHAACVPRAMTDEFREQFGGGYLPPSPNASG